MSLMAPRSPGGGQGRACRLDVRGVARARPCPGAVPRRDVMADQRRPGPRLRRGCGLMTHQILRWEEPAATKAEKYAVWIPVVSALKERPGQWAVIAEVGSAESNNIPSTVR